MRYLLDTNVISEYATKQPNQRVLTWLDQQDPSNLFLSVITIGELNKGITKLPASNRKNLLHAWLHDDLLLRFSGRILSLDSEVMLEWGDLTGRLELAGKPLPAIDSLIAALALHYNCSIVTRNEDHFKTAGITVINPWRPNG
jgi:toxin FitB